MKKNQWYTVRNQSLAVYARQAGFDLAIYSQYSKEVQAELRRRTIAEALAEIDSQCDEMGVDIYGVTKGLYVISLSNPLSIQYVKRRSQVIYVGMGSIMSRIKSHFNKSLFDFMESLSGANFDFEFACPARKGPSKDYYKHIEYLMLDYFSEHFGGTDTVRRFPLLNKNAGSDRGFAGGTHWWKKPLKVSGTRPYWELKPTSHSDFPPLDSK